MTSAGARDIPAKLIGTVAGTRLVGNYLMQISTAFSSELVLDARKADGPLTAI